MDPSSLQGKKTPLGVNELKYRYCIATGMHDEIPVCQNNYEVMSKLRFCPFTTVVQRARKWLQSQKVGLIWAMSWENLFMPYANNKGADQPAHSRSLFSAFVVRCLDSIYTSACYSRNFKNQQSRPVWVLPGCKKHWRQVLLWRGSYISCKQCRLRSLCHSMCMFWMYYCVVKPHYWNFMIIIHSHQSLFFIVKINRVLWT